MFLFINRYIIINIATIMKCKGKNLDGTPCKRNISDDSEYCWQHIQGIWNKV